MDVRRLIRKMSRENPLWGAPRIHELLKLGIDTGETSVSKYMGRLHCGDLPDVGRDLLQAAYE
jgi:hypothetical protein